MMDLRDDRFDKFWFHGRQGPKIYFDRDYNTRKPLHKIVGYETD